MNAGERDELLIKLKLIEMRDNGIPFPDGTLVNSVGFHHEYLSLPVNFKWTKITNDQELIDLCNNVGVTKAAGNFKSDVYINREGYSLKSFSAAPPALVNHTARPGFETACIHSNINISELDVLIEKYWELRLSGRISEDVRNSNPESPFKNAKATIKPILEYYLFKGTGRGPSPEPANFILDYSNPLDSSTWKKLTPTNAVDIVWDKLIFSVRSKKGMPKDYDMNTYNKDNATSIALWTKYHGGEYRGALHIRASK